MSSLRVTSRINYETAVYKEPFVDGSILIGNYELIKTSVRRERKSRKERPLETCSLVWHCARLALEIRRDSRGTPKSTGDKTDQLPRDVRVVTFRPVANSRDGSVCFIVTTREIKERGFSYSASSPFAEREVTEKEAREDSEGRERERERERERDAQVYA